MRAYRVWERCIYKPEIITAENIFAAVRQFAGVNVLCLNNTSHCFVVTKNNYGRFIAEDGSAREFGAYPVTD